MPSYRVLAKSFIGVKLYEEGDTVTIDNIDPLNGGMEPGSNLALLDDEGEPAATKPARKAKQAAAPDANDLG